MQCSIMAQDVVLLPKGTAIRLRLAETLQCENSHEGDSIAFEVVDPIKIDGEKVISEGALAVGRIVDDPSDKTRQTHPTRRVGKGGRVAFEMKYVTDVTGREIPITEERYIRGRGRGTEIVLGMVSYPVTSPLWLLVEGHHTKFPHGKTVVVETATEWKVNLTQLRANLRNQNPAVTPASAPLKPSTPEYQRAMAAAVQPAAVVNQQVASPKHVYTLTNNGKLIASR